MTRKVVFTRIADEKISSILLCLLENWSLKVKREFLVKVKESVELIRDNPQVFPKSQLKPGLRSCVLTKHNLLFFSYDETSVTILTIFDTRQDPNKLKKEFSKIG